MKPSCDSFYSIGTQLSKRFRKCKFQTVVDVSLQVHRNRFIEWCVDKYFCEAIISTHWKSTLCMLWKWSLFSKEEWPILNTLSTNNIVGTFGSRKSKNNNNNNIDLQVVRFQNRFMATVPACVQINAFASVCWSFSIFFACLVEFSHWVGNLLNLFFVYLRTDLVSCHALKCPCRMVKRKQQNTHIPKH